MMNHLECLYRCVQRASQEPSSNLLTFVSKRKLSSKRNKRNPSENKDREHRLLDGDGSDIPVDSTFTDRQEIMFVRTI